MNMGRLSIVALHKVAVKYSAPKQEKKFLEIFQIMQ